MAKALIDNIRGMLSTDPRIDNRFLFAAFRLFTNIPMFIGLTRMFQPDRRPVSLRDTEYAEHAEIFEFACIDSSLRVLCALCASARTR